mmetsp:Transcript_10493/g.29164  ORF Transcript_10493/g.29164 Transcript_10493/m.29164 type:complete len:191 (-) Transcript_10493:75-647(-)
MTWADGRSLAELANEAGEALKASGQTLAAVEATTAGLIAACLQAQPQASRYWQGGVSIYSAKAVAALVPREVRIHLGDVKVNYSSGANYVRSKEVFTSVLARYYRDQFGVDWVVAESGAADARGLPSRIRDSGAFTVATVVGPGGLEESRIYRAPAQQSREENMWAFAAFALGLLAECARRLPPASVARL